jgi:hypothetical protein
MTRLFAIKRLACMALLTGATLAHAQNQAIPNAPASAAKKELVQRMVALQQPALDNMARSLAERPARQMMAAADQALQTRVPPEKRQAVAEQIQAEMRKFLDEAVPLIRDRANKIAPTSLGSVFEEKFSEDELRQLLATLESPVYKKFQQSLPDLTNAFVQTLVADVEPTINPKLNALEQRVASALGVNAPGPAASEPKAAKAAKPAASAASKPAKK